MHTMFVSFWLEKLFDTIIVAMHPSCSIAEKFETKRPDFHLCKAVNGNWLHSEQWDVGNGFAFFDQEAMAVRGVIPRHHASQTRVVFDPIPSLWILL
jgi:hypothetical protein